MAFCTHCGAPLPDGAKFCTHCGTPVAAAPSPGPAQPSRPAYTQPVQPRENSVQAPSASGEFTAVTWDEPGSQPAQPAAAPGPAPQYQQPSAPQQPQGPMTMQQAMDKTKNDLFGKYTGKKAAPAQDTAPKKKRSVWVWIVVILVGLMYLAMKLGW